MSRLGGSPIPASQPGVVGAELTGPVLHCLHRERQDADGQMKELQDQLEAEQYFSVSPLYIRAIIAVLVAFLQLWLQNQENVLKIDSYTPGSV